MRRYRRPPPPCQEPPGSPDPGKEAGTRGTRVKPKPKIMVVGLDACDPDLVRRFAAAGELPTLARLLSESGHAISRNPYGLFVGSLWSSFFTARSAVRTGFHCWEEVDPRDYERKLTSPLDLKGTPFWETLSG